MRLPCQHKREPLTSDESDRLINAAESFQEKLVYSLARFCLIAAHVCDSFPCGATDSTVDKP